MRILLTNSPLHYSHGHTFTQPDWQTLVLPYIAACIKGNHKFRLVDNNNSWWSPHNIIEEVVRYDPDVIGFSIIAARDIYNTLKVIKEVRRLWPERIIIAGGQGATAYKELLAKNDVDCVVCGEGEEVLSRLFMREGYPNSLTPYAEATTQINLDDSPLPLWHLMPERESRWFPGRLVGSMEMSRGCPWSCNFCCIHTFWKHYRAKSNNRILAELENLSKMGRTHIYLADDNFGMNITKHSELFEELIRRKPYKLKIPVNSGFGGSRIHYHPRKDDLDIKFFTQIRADTVADNPEMMALAAKAGLYGVLVGFDSYSPAMFKEMGKDGGLDVNRRCSEILRDNGIMIFGSHIYALPGQKTPQEWWPTFREGRKNSDLFRMPHFSLLPGTHFNNTYLTSKKILAAKLGLGDARIFIRNRKERGRFKRWYTIFTVLYWLSPTELWQMFFNKNRNVRILKRLGFLATARHYLYRFLRWLRIGII
jgi:anaerobic magnesium-protoporphyrin IX monomethyl ester cyclase